MRRHLSAPEANTTTSFLASLDGGKNGRLHMTPNVWDVDSWCDVNESRNTAATVQCMYQVQYQGTYIQVPKKTKNPLPAGTLYGTVVDNHVCMIV